MIAPPYVGGVKASNPASLPSNTAIAWAYVPAGVPRGTSMLTYGTVATFGMYGAPSASSCGYPPPRFTYHGLRESCVLRSATSGTVRIDGDCMPGSCLWNVTPWYVLD